MIHQTAWLVPHKKIEFYSTKTITISNKVQTADNEAVIVIQGLSAVQSLYIKNK